MNISQIILYSLPLISALGGGTYSALTSDSKKPEYLDKIILTSLFSAIAIPTIPLWGMAYLYYQIVKGEDEDEDEDELTFDI